MGNFILLVEHDESARRRWRRKLEGRGYEAIEAGSAVSALELLQRLPKAFRLVLVQADLPGLPGAALIETLRLFRPELPVFCLGSAEGAVVEVGCPTVSEAGEELELHLQAFAEGGDGWRDTSRLAPEAIRRACERYEATRDLVEAAYEVTKGLPDR